MMAMPCMRKRRHPPPGPLARADLSLQGEVRRKFHRIVQQRLTDHDLSRPRRGSKRASRPCDEMQSPRHATERLYRSVAGAPAGGAVAAALVWVGMSRSTLAMVAACSDSAFSIFQCVIPGV